MPGNLEKFRNLLSEMFMFDHAELDFGIYRIMGAKREEITQFLDKDLLPQVRGELKKLGTGSQSQIKLELDKAIEAAKEAGFDPEDSPKVKDLRARYKAGPDLEAMENEVFSHLTSFFRRYYDKGDFISQRRYKEGVYAIPYEGEEVKLYWANHDQYYIKTTENFRDYTFKLADGRRVHFKLAEADTEANNVKAAAGQERRFILCENDPVAEENGESIIRFEYRPDSEKRKQTELNTEAASKILAVPGFTEWKAALATLMPTEKNPGRTLLDKHLAEYTARNTFDYFIHKDLGKFLRRELDFYIKSEVMHLDDIDSEEPPKVEQYLAKVKAMRRIAHKIIDLLAQLEDFQKKLWLKKKFVVETNYCVTLDRVPETLYPKIAANDAQREEWVRLFAIDEIKKTLTCPAYSKSLKVDFLKANPYLVLDTRFFSQEFKDRLLASFDDLDEQTDGLLVHSENFQALNLLMERYREQVKCVYIDPPYNTGNDGFLYKDNFQHSSWLSVQADRFSIATLLLAESGVVFVSIDDSELYRLNVLMGQILGDESFLEQIIWRKRSTPPNDKMIGANHEYVSIFGKSLSNVGLNLRQRSPDQVARYRNPDNHPKGPWVPGDLMANVKGGRYVASLYFPIVNPHTGEEHFPSSDGNWRFSRETIGRLIADNEIWFGEDRRGRPKLKRFLCDVKEGVTYPTIWDFVQLNTDGSREMAAYLGILTAFENPKPSGLLCELLKLGACDDSLVLDFFGGSGTTAHAVINLNREDGGTRKYILVEMGDYFDTVLKPRIQKVIYSKDWKDGKPASREGSSHLFKYLRLESYEDTLNNLEVKRTEDQKLLLEASPEFREDYLLRYMLEVESWGSASLLNVERFEDPFSYQLHIATGSVGETRPMTVDLVETFNYLLGLRVKHIDTIREFKVVEGTNPEGEKVLVIWRKVGDVGNGRRTVPSTNEEGVTGIGTATDPYAGNDDVKSNSDLDAFFLKQEYNPRDQEFDLIYVNGDNNLENLKRPDETWKVRLIETEFKRLMFDVQDV